jgi:poly [ADP-ribose] polymerase
MGKQVKLLMVTQQNNNKYYDMVDNGDGTLTVTYGRVDVTAINKTYPSYKWDSIAQ